MAQKRPKITWFGKMTSLLSNITVRVRTQIFEQRREEAKKSHIHFMLDQCLASTLALSISILLH